jgi:carbon monoxide dehydrogenase subunit G
MSLYRKVLLGTGAVLLLAAAIGMMLPRHVRVERSIVVNAPRPAVFEVLNSFRRFNEWSPWAQLDPGAKYAVDGPPSGVGAKLSWVGDPATLGSGSQEIVESREPELVRMKIDFGPARAAGTFTLTPDGAGTRVTWALETDLGMNPVSRYFGRMLDGMIGGDFERGLQGLKRFAEEGATGQGK